MERKKFWRGDITAAETLDEKGRHCGRKPLVYKRDGHRFCMRCDRAFHLYQNFQIPNWAWKRQQDGQFVYSAGAYRIGQSPLAEAQS